MGYVVRMPQLGMSMEEGTVVEWCIAAGEQVREGDPIAIVESEKTTAEVEAREDGVLREIVVPEGETVAPGEPIGVIADPDEDLDQYPTVHDDSADGNKTEVGDSPDVEDATAESSEASGVRATPGARRHAAEMGIDLAAVEGTGPQGVVTEADVEDHADRAGAATRTVAETRSLSGMQQTVAERLGESSREAVHVTLNRSVDATALTETLAAAHDAEVEVSLIDLLIVATCEALEAHPSFNATFEDGEHQLVEEVNVGVAVDLDGGLVTPVLPDVAGKCAETIAEGRRNLVDRVRDGEFTSDDLAGGTFTVTNLGPFGVDHFDPVIDPPQVAILGVGRIREDGTLTLSLSFDHRVVNGADAARFLATLVERATDAGALASAFETPLPDDSPDAKPSGRAEETREIRVKSTAGLAGSYAVSGADSVTFDEPTEAGGSGTAPTPVEHLLGALGSCLSLAVRAMADRDGVAIGSVEAAVDGTPDQGPLEAVSIDITLESDATDEALDQVVTKAERACYVERALADDVAIEVSWTRR